MGQVWLRTAQLRLRASCPAGRDPFPWTNPSLTGPGSELFTCLSVPQSGGGWQRGGAIPVPEGMGSNGPITAKPDRGDWP